MFIGEVRKIRRMRARIYDEEFKRVLVWILELLDYIFGKRLAASLRWLVPKLVEQGGAEGKEEGPGELDEGPGGDDRQAVKAGEEEV